MFSCLLLSGGNQADLSGGNWGFVLLCSLVLLAAAVLTGFPIAISNRRRNPLSELILAGSLFWGVAATWSTLSWVIAAWNWSKEKNTLMLAGYYKTAVADPGPQIPWIWWIALAALFLVLLSLSFRRGPAPSP
ncbi:MAG TPA: hypothetical protein VMU54_08495 [Planctomycetota bacterium]|nr:hypothetical protein [Planctomycetota bacterium]